MNSNYRVRLFSAPELFEHLKRSEETQWDPMEESGGQNLNLSRKFF